MSRVLVWKCDQDGKLFEDKTKYRNHLRKLARERAHQKKLEEAEVNRAEFIQKMCSVRSFEELEQFIKDHWSWFYYNGATHEAWKVKKTSTVHEYVSVKFSNIRWSNRVSNSHSCPKNGVTNWGNRNPDAPTGYPGWMCTVQIRVKTSTVKTRGKTYYESGFGCSYFKGTPIYTGTGGGGEKEGITSYTYACEIWAGDFWAMAEEREKDLMWQILGGAERNKILVG